MSREIKFRAWDAQRKEMYYYSLREARNRQILDSCCFNYKYEMQYTGVNDKNGIEIYEGDIMCDYDNEIIGTVEFVKGAFYVHSLPEKEFYDLWDFSCEEVIGNIYENPELLS